MFNRLGLLLVSALILFSSAIYAHEDRNVAALNGYYLDSSLCLAAAEKAGEKYGVSYDLLKTVSAVERISYMPVCSPNRMVRISPSRTVSFRFCLLPEAR